MKPLNLVSYVCPDHHYLESWDDAEPVKGKYQSCSTYYPTTF